MTTEQIEVKCPHCGKLIILSRDTKGRWVATISGVSIGAVVGGLIGAGIGIATGGWGIAATIPAGIALGVMLGGAGYIIGDKLIDKFKCPSCGGEIVL